MGARAIGTGTISFGLVTIPVKLYSTNVPSSGVSFHLLHKECKSRIKQQYVCPVHDSRVVERDEIVKGYEFAKGQYVTFTDEELAAIEEQASEAIEIAEFVPAARIDPVFFDKAYYLGPDKGGDKAYGLLREAMKRTGRCALAKYAARGKQYLVLIRPIDRGLAMQQLRYADEVKPFSEIDVAEIPVKEKELDLAVQLIEQIASDEFHPERYEDEVKKRILELIQKKVEGEEITAAPPAAQKGQIIDLMEALKASLERRPAATTGTKAAAATAGPAKAERKGPKAAPRTGAAAAKRRTAAKE